MVVPAFAQTTIKGELVDQACYTSKGPQAGAGAGHAACAQACAKKGQQVALVVSPKEIYLLAGAITAESNKALVPHMSHMVALTGTVTEKGGVKTITVAAGGLMMSK
jgi:hypothetical protein